MKRLASAAIAAAATIALLAPAAQASPPAPAAQAGPPAHAVQAGPPAHAVQAGPPAHAQGQNNGRPAVYQMTGDEGGSKFEGIGADTRRNTFYVSEVTGGEIHRGTMQNARMTQWLGGDGTDGRWTARGIKVDHAGNVYIAGGPNSIDHPGAPNLWVYSAQGTLLAALAAPGDNVFLNDVIIGPDGAAYFTDSNTPRIFRVAQSHAGWQVSEWANAADTIEQLTGFNLGGIVVSADRSALVVAQGTTGDLWRFALADGSVSPIDTGGADLVNADGLVRSGNKLTVVQNFSKQISTLRLSADGSQARLLDQRPSDQNRVLTTAAELNGRILYVDSKFDEPTATPPYEIITSTLNGTFLR